ncbi:thioredoxin-dependent thiol peroxidase [Sulfurospirillum sp. 1612]|uniref:thioredoxin-dependent thiol peroxidase n=1 Tax=Sulfurospirillum sp. 1612 TaxID=3094835 RepID=UPI002F94D67E
MLEVGQDAPEFCLPNQDEVEICFRDLKGKWIVLYFYPKDNTPGCTTEACEFTAMEPDFSELDAIIVGVSPDSPKSHRNFIAKKELDIMLLSDMEKEVAKAYGVWQLKKLYGKEYMGIVRSTFLISPEGKIAALWTKVKVKNHVEAVMETLSSLKSI